MARLPLVVGLAVLVLGVAAVWLGTVPWERDPYAACAYPPSETTPVRVSTPWWPPAASRCVIAEPGASPREGVVVFWDELIMVACFAAAAALATAAVVRRRRRAARAAGAFAVWLGGLAVFFL